MKAVNDVLTRDISADLDAGEEFVTLNRARHDPRLKIDGRARDLSWVHRCVTAGVRGNSGGQIVLEAAIVSGRKATTAGAIARFVHKQIVASGAAIMPPSVHEGRVTNAR